MQYQLFQCLRTFNDSDDIEAIAMSSDGKTLISGSWDLTIKIWHLSTGELQRTLTGHRLGVMAVAISPNQQILASGSRDETIKLWDFHTGEVRHTLEPYAEESGRELACLVFSPDGQILYSGSQGGSTYYWDVNTGKLLGNLGIISLGSSLLAISADGRTLAGVKSGSLIVDDLPQHTLRFKIETDRNTPSLAISPDGETIYIGDYHGNVHLWDSRTAQKLETLQGYPNKIPLWDSRTAQQSGTLNKPLGIVKALAISPDGKMLASGYKQGTLKLWELDSKTEVCSLEAHSADISGIIFSPDGQTLVSSSVDTTIKVWRVR